MIGGTLKATRRAWEWSIQLHQGNRRQFFVFKRHLRWAASAAVRRAAGADWFALLERPEMRPFAEVNPRLAFRPLGVYLSTRWDFARRVKIIQETYEFIHAHGGILRQAMLGGPALLATFPFGKLGEATLHFGPNGKFRKEGEVVVSLEASGVPGPISYLVFTLERGQGGWCLHVGAVQGRTGGDEETIKEVTKAMHGLRPKAFMVFLAQEIARTLRVKELRGIGNAIHVFRARNARISGPKRRILFDYDALWEEAGGELMPDGWFRLPLKASRRVPEEIKPNKRGMYAKRYAMMDTISRQIRTVLTPFPRA